MPVQLDSVELHMHEGHRGHPRVLKPPGASLVLLTGWKVIICVGGNGKPEDTNKSRIKL